MHVRVRACTRERAKRLALSGGLHAHLQHLEHEVLQLLVRLVVLLPCVEILHVLDDVRGQSCPKLLVLAAEHLRSGRGAGGRDQSNTWKDRSYRQSQYKVVV